MDSNAAVERVSGELATLGGGALLVALPAVGALRLAGEDRVDLTDALRQLHDDGARTVLCEGGPALIAELLEADLLDELCLTLAPMTGGDPLGLVGGDERPGLTRFHLQHVIRCDDELYLRYLAPGRDPGRDHDA